MRITCDVEVDALYIRFIETSVNTQHVAEGVALDYAADGRIAGIEILDARTRWTPPPTVGWPASRSSTRGGAGASGRGQTLDWTQVGRVRSLWMSARRADPCARARQDRSIAAPGLVTPSIIGSYIARLLWRAEPCGVRTPEQ